MVVGITTIVFLIFRRPIIADIKTAGLKRAFRRPPCGPEGRRGSSGSLQVMSSNPGTGRQPAWVALLQFTAVGAGLALGLTLTPEALAAVLFTTLLQAATTVIGWRALGGPVVYVGAIAVVILGIAADPALRELLYLGGVPYVHLGLALATVSLVGRARTSAEFNGAAMVLCASLLTVGVVLIDQGAPASMALLASSVPVLGGALIATSLRLRRARQDRLVRRSLPVTPAAASDAERARSSLAQVALLSETLAEDPPDARTAAWAAEVQQIALRGLEGGPRRADGSGRVRVELRVEDAGSSGDLTDRSGPSSEERPAAPDLSDREREIAHLLTTGASNAAIARDLYLSEATIKGHVSRMMRRLNCENRTQLALLATRWSL